MSYLRTYKGMKFYYTPAPIVNYKSSLKSPYTFIGSSHQKRLINQYKENSFEFVFEYEQNSVKERKILRSIFKELKGKYTPFLLRSFTKDFNVFENTDYEIIVGNPSFFEIFKLLPFRVHIFIEEYDLIAEIVDVKPVTYTFDGIEYIETDVVYLVLDTYIGFLNLDENTCLELVYPVRLNTDSLVFQHYDINNSSCSLSFKTIIDPLPLEEQEPDPAEAV